MVSINFREVADFRGETAGAEPLVSGIHSGNAGDIIYSLPAVRALGVRHLYLNVFRSAADPLRKLTEETAAALAPLLLAQPYIDRVTVVSSGVSLEQIDPECLNVNVVLDGFRLQRASELHLIAAHARATRSQVQGDRPFLTVPATQRTEEPYVIVALTPRYRSLTDEFLRDLMLCFKRIVLVGLPEEWRTVAGMDGEIWRAPDFLQLAERIAGAALFIGNPNLPYAIAEGLKGLRIVDLPSDIRNAFPLGPRGFVIPSTKAGFYELLSILCSESEELQRCCRLDRLKSTPEQPREQISLSQEASEGRCAASVAFPDLFRVGDAGILLHPPPPGFTPSEIVFDEIDVAGEYRFSTEAYVDHPDSAPVLMSILVRSNGVPVAQWTSEVIPGNKYSVDLDLPALAAPLQFTLQTQMVENSPSSNFAWAWFGSPRLAPR